MPLGSTAPALDALLIAAVLEMELSDRDLQVAAKRYELIAEHLQRPSSKLADLMGSARVYAQSLTPQPVGTQHPSIVPYGSFATADAHVIVACLTERFWHNFARCIGRPELIEDPRFAAYEARLQNRAALEPIILAAMGREGTAYWLERLSEFDVPNAPILSVAEALEQEHVAAHGLVETVEHPELGPMRLVRGPILFDGEGPSAATPPSRLGADTAEVLRDRLGYSEAQLAQLDASGVIGASLSRGEKRAVNVD